MLKKADILLALALITIGLAISYFLSLGRSPGNLLEVSCSGETFGTFPLSENREISVDRNGHINKITISNGAVSMSFSDCTGQDCIHQGAISQTGESIVCLPNEVILKISGDDKVYDSISR